MAAKTVSVLGDDGAGKKTLIGSLIYKCGLQLPQIEELEREGIRDFAKITTFYEKKGYDRGFYGPSGFFVVQESHGQVSDVVFWILDASDAASWASSAQKLSMSLSSGTLQPKEKLLVLVNKMDLVGWSQHVFEDLLRIFDAVDLKQDHIFVPISSLRGENILSPPDEHSWVNNVSISLSTSAAHISDRPLMNQL
ncbi:hypothetical protein S7711_09997 [Stachybotrys chartarum IBT 7711]|uniref:Tr-type G domain-containing protein n=1 Tax=Stachybotrys chartarum (strain CBS 109288 / IBT 7711) TaxID=1280523 RepID=A0A084B8R4_STACB|nr:hypothetical protein S7711_09997 [Stachybotrys chartarum IBT 7711]KFA79425.1 hypothetical protein S40288_09882 [Stachybotrys chartarum IBT 40288]